MSNLKTSLVATMAALALGASLTAAEAGPKKWGGGYHHHHHGGFRHGGAIAGGILGAVALGAIATHAYSAGGCWVEEEERIDRFGRIYVRPVRVCN